MPDMRPTQPPLLQPLRPLYRSRLPGKSHLHRYRGRNCFPFFQDRLIDTSGYHIDQSYHEPVSQQLLQQIMDNQTLYQHGIDSGDETCSLNDYFAESFPVVGPGMQNVRSQTAAQAVSLANCGRDFGPSHPLYSNKAAPGNEQMVFPDHPAANAYAHDLNSNFSQQHFHYSSYNPNALCNSSLGIEFQHGLPSSTEMYSNMPMFAEPFECTNLNPGTFNSSFSSSASSSIASERMASMTLESAPQHDRTLPMDFRANHHVSSSGIEGHGWVGNCPATISPKMLRINPSPTPMSSSESIQASIAVANHDSDLGSSAWDHHEARNILPPKRSNHKTRKELPTKPTKSRLASSSLPHESVTSKGKGKAQTQRSPPPPLRSLIVPAPARLVSKSHQVAEVHGSVATLPSAPTDVENDAERDAKNRFLVESKLAGMTYREIRRQGGFTEAESTLRGRFRTLTKNKEQRVRKPEWQDKDIRLLKRAVRKLSKGDRTSARVPWKQVAAYIYEHDGSYHFGNATCRKKWDELVEQGAAGLS
ncbi:hypothetical protein ONZ43_g2629 [Nemania bipapillata]|uniref:Uncharacterized protein n=1 Tax=Nemania bipapillata TaxID=110536 RepID=A0ACC2J019_9PEZI|nr:hypothetical protein ONZ43_g2629 [Nemania bipapillata]